MLIYIQQFLDSVFFSKTTMCDGLRIFQPTRMTFQSQRTIESIKLNDAIENQDDHLQKHVKFDF